MNLFEFINHFPTEDDCLNHFVSVRLKAGITCSRCGCTKHIQHRGIFQFECINCGFHTHIKSGTAMENSKLPVKYWFITIFLLTSDENKSSITEIRSKLGHFDNVEVTKMLNQIILCQQKTKVTNSFDNLVLACLNWDERIIFSKTDKPKFIKINTPLLNN